MVCSTGVSPLEKMEGLEQLRALEKGMSIGAMQTETMPLGVNRLEDLEKVEACLYGQK